MDNRCITNLITIFLSIKIVTGSDEFLQVCSNAFIDERSTNQVINSGGSINEEWFQWGQLYSFCMQYESATKNATSQLDINCSTTGCQNCMKACSIPLSFDLSACQANCSSIECNAGCQFYSEIKSGNAKSDHNNKPVTDSNSIQVQETDVISLTFKWHNILSKSSPVLSSLYLVVLVSERSTKKHINVLGLSASNERVITKDNICSSYTSIYDKYKETKYKLEIYPINFNGYNSSTFIQSNYTNLAPGSQVQNLTINPNPGFIAESRPVRDRISWDMTWSPPSSDLINGTKLKVTIEVVECIEAWNRHEATKTYDMNASPVTISVDTTDKDELKGCLIQVLAETEIESCILGESIIQKMKYEGCHTVIDRGCSFVTATTTPRPIDEPIPNDWVILTLSNQKCLIYERSTCGSNACLECKSASQDIIVSWRRPATYSPIQHYVVRWGNRMKFIPFLFIGKEYNKTHVEPSNITYTIRNFKTNQTELIVVQVFAQTSTMDGTKGYSHVNLELPLPKIFSMQQPDHYVTDDRFLSLCSNSFITSPNTNQIIRDSESIKDDWFRWGRLYSFCMQYDSGTQNITQAMDQSCESHVCRECMKPCHLPLPFSLAECEQLCDKVVCRVGCKFYEQVNHPQTEIPGDFKLDTNNKPKHLSHDVSIIHKNRTSISLQWLNVLSDSSPSLSSVYLLVLESMSGLGGSNKNVLGLSSISNRVITVPNICSGYESNNKVEARKYKLHVYSINYNGYNKMKFLTSNTTNIQPMKSVRNLNILPKPGYVKSTMQLAPDRITWNVTWSPPVEFLLLPNANMHARVEVKVINCSNPDNYEKIMKQVTYNIFEFSINETQVTISQINTDQDDLNTCLLEVKVSTIYGGCLLGESAVQYIEYGGCQTVDNYDCSTIATTPKPTDEPIVNGWVQLSVASKKCARYSTTICLDGFLNVTCHQCDSLLYDIFLTWRKPFTTSPIQHYVLRWGKATNLLTLRYLATKDELGKVIVASNETSYMLKDVYVIKGGLPLTVQIHPKTASSGDVGLLGLGYTEKQLEEPLKAQAPPVTERSYTTDDGFFNVCSNNFLKGKTNQISTGFSNDDINEQWFKWGQLYSYCIQYDSATKNISSEVDMNCENATCRNCMTPCMMPTPFDVTLCERQCNSSECKSSCVFFGKINRPQAALMNDEQSLNAPKTGDIIVTHRNFTSVTFKWNDVVSPEYPNLSNVYLVVIRVTNKHKQEKQNVLGLTTASKRTVTAPNLCSTFTIYGIFTGGTKYKLLVYPINVNVYNKDNYMESNFTSMEPLNAIKDLIIHPKATFIDNSHETLIPNRIQWDLSWTLDLSHASLLYEDLYMSTELLRCRISANLRAVVSSRIVQKDVKVSASVNHTTFFETNTQLDELKTCTIEVQMDTLYGQCLRGGATVATVTYEGCDTVDNYVCPITTTSTPVPTNQPITPNMITIIKLKSECVNMTDAMCFDGERNSSCKVCTATEYMLNVQWQKPSTPKPILQYTVRWGEGTTFIDKNSTIFFEATEINRTIVSSEITSYNITGVRVTKRDFRFAVQIIVWTGAAPDDTFLSKSGYKEIRLDGPSGPSIPIIPPVVHAASDSNKTEKIILGIMIPLVLIALCFIVVLYIFHRRRPKKSPLGMSFSKGTLDMYMDQDEIPADEWEIFPKNIILDEKIGEGAFGTVFSATIEATVLAKSQYAKQKGGAALLAEKNPKVAVKLLKDGASQLEYNDFKEEILLMKDIGYHRNIVNLIGCSTVKNPLCLIVEFMEHGDLLHFLRKRRTKVCTAQTSESNSSQSYAYTQMFSSNPQNADQNSKTELMPGSVSSEPDDTDSITADDLLSFVWQICCGMEYLAQHNLVHRDLAARNLLVGADRVVKVSDFGLARAVSTDLIYMSNKNRKLPIKWMSVEAIFDQVFTTYSDVWAYGVVLFEIITLGGTPYPSISNRELLGMLKSGYRMEKPENCADLMYDIMLHCWNEDPLQRPTFTELREHLEDIMTQDDRYFSFDINEDNTYYNVASFKSVPSDEEIDDQVIDDEIMQKPIQVKTIDDLKKLQEKQDGEDIVKKLQDHDVNTLANNQKRYIELQALGKVSPDRTPCIYMNNGLEI